MPHHRGPIDPGELLVAREVECPYCGAGFEAVVDLSAGSQSYVEDCHVCCRPIEFVVEIDEHGELASLALAREDD